MREKVDSNREVTDEIDMYNEGDCEGVGQT